MLRCARNTMTILAGLALGACAHLEELVATPGVTLANVTAEEIGFDRQVFLLSLDIDNPNPFPLPLLEIHYGVELDGMRFASGELPASLRVPARGNASLDIRVETNLVETVPDLLFALSEGHGRSIPYRLHGEFHTAIPNAAPVRFDRHGAVQLAGDL